MHLQVAFLILSKFLCLSNNRVPWFTFEYLLQLFVWEKLNCSLTSIFLLIFKLFCIFKSLLLCVRILQVGVFVVGSLFFLKCCMIVVNLMSYILVLKYLLEVHNTGKGLIHFMYQLKFLVVISYQIAILIKICVKLSSMLSKWVHEFIVLKVLNLRLHSPKVQIPGITVCQSVWFWISQN